MLLKHERTADRSALLNGFKVEIGKRADVDKIQAWITAKLAVVRDEFRVPARGKFAAAGLCPIRASD
jgi:hypothetical protein